MIIGVMDSGIGGLTTLCRLMEVCGGEYIFVSDEMGPYGDKDDEFVFERTMTACNELKRYGAQIIVLACNTATNVAIHKLRECDKSFNYIGIEPAVKPALNSCSKIAVALTPTAARQEKFIRLISAKKDRIRLITLPYLASEIEKSYFDKAALITLAADLYAQCYDCNGLVLGCTHYIYLKEYLTALNPNLKIYDGNDGVARRLFKFTGNMGAATVKFVKIK